MNPMDVKRKALQAVKGYGREGLGEHLKQGYMKPAVAIEIKSVKAMPEHEGMEEEAEGEGMMPPKKLAMHEGMEPEGVKEAEGEYGEDGEGEHEMPDGSMMADSAMKKGKSEITPELLEMLLEKLGK